MDYQKEKIKSPSITPASDRSIMLRFEDGISEYIHEHVFYFHSLLVNKFKKKIANTSPAYNSILIRLADGVSVWRMIAKLKQLFEEEHEISIEQKQTVKIPVCYDKEFALDIDRVSKHTKLSTDEIIHLHTKGKYLVYFLGFSPGFPYIGGMDQKLETPRLNSPRIEVMQGSVAIGGKQTGIYPITSPGGWNIIGRTPLILFDWNKISNPILQMGARIQFYAISHKEFSQHQGTLF